MSKINPMQMPSRQDCKMMEQMAQKIMMLMDVLLKDGSPNNIDQRSRVAMCFHLSIALMVACADLGHSCEDRSIVDPTQVMQ